MGRRFYTGKQNITLNGLETRRIRVHASGGQTLVEYSLILAFISVVAIGVLITTGGSVKGVFTTVTNQLSVSSNGGPYATPPGH